MPRIPSSVTAITLSALLSFALGTGATTFTLGSSSGENPGLSRPAEAGLDATLFLQRAQEYRGICRQTWRGAESALLPLLEDGSHSACVEQGPHAELLPPAIIVDIDETVLDNSPYQARLVADGERYSDETWAAWCHEAKAKPVPGALRFAQRAEALGITIFYVTNRRAELEGSTRKNLGVLGFPVRADRDVLLMHSEHEGWGSDKASRRREVTKTHRVLLMVGDDFNDFCSGVRAAHSTRDVVFAEQAHRFGHDWFVLPNPTYGSWMRAVTRGAEDALMAKRAALDTARD